MLDYRQQWEALLDNESPFSVVVMAHLKTLETSGNPFSRKQWKLSLIKLLYQRGYDRTDVLQLLRFIDWLLALPTDLEADLWQDIRTYQEEMNMPYVTSLERLAENRGREEGLAKGLAEGIKRGIRVALKLKFGEAGLRLFPEIEDIADTETLTSIEAGLESELSLSEIRRLYRQDS